MPTETVPRRERAVSQRPPEKARGPQDEALRERARRHLEQVRKFKLYLSIYVLSMLVLTPIWIVTQYETQDGWPEHLSTRSRYPGDWDPWIIWIGILGAVLVAITGVRAYRSRPTREPHP